MKQQIATIATIVVVAIFAIQIAAAQAPVKKFTTDEKKIEFASKNLLVGLRSDNQGLIEAALRVSAKLKMRYPAADVSVLVNEMQNIFEDHPKGSTRYKAYIAISICENPEWYLADEKLAAADEDDFFKKASSRMQEQLLSVYTR